MREALWSLVLDYVFSYISDLGFQADQAQRKSDNQKEQLTASFRAQHAELRTRLQQAESKVKVSDGDYRKQLALVQVSLHLSTARTLIWNLSFHIDIFEHLCLNVYKNKLCEYSVQV